MNLLSKPPSTTTPSLEAGDSTGNAILKLAQLLKRVQKIPNHVQEMNPLDKTNDGTSPRVAPEQTPMTKTTQLLPKVVEGNIARSHHVEHDDDEIEPPMSSQVN